MDSEHGRAYNPTTPQETPGMTTATTTPPATERSQGRAHFWVGIAACVLGLALAVVQFGLKHLFVPWYAPVLATLGAVLLLVAVARRPGVVRIVVLLVITALAGLEWFFLVSLMKLPAYEGPAQVGKQLPAFTATLADGRPFTEANLRDRSRRVMTFFRGRW
jgi:hypothetical protein